MWDFVLFSFFFSLIPSLSCLYFLASSHVPCCSKAGASNSKDMGGDSVVYCTEKIMFPFWGGRASSDGMDVLLRKHSDGVFSVVFFLGSRVLLLLLSSNT